ncbi:MAG: hypothetical protein ACI8S6_002904 [Myxococcota bacterium]|jgi:hypothetical protein
MLRALLTGADLSMIRDYVSPVFFDIMPARQLTSEARAIAGGRLRSADDERAALSATLPEGLVLGEADGALPAAPALRRAHGQRLLQLYFHQLYTSPTAFLDLRPERFAVTDAQSRWSPGWLRIRWEPDFIEPIRRLYLGYYSEDDAAFSEALEALSLTAARETFLDHFGGGDQRAVHFERAHFHQTFHEVFLACAESGAQLHRNFVSLGLMLGCLYAHLEPLGLALDVRTAHDAVAPPRLRAG